MRPESRLRAPDDGLADEDEAVVADVLSGEAHQLLAGSQESAVGWRQRGWTLDGCKEEKEA